MKVGMETVQYMHSIQVSLLYLAKAWHVCTQQILLMPNIKIYDTTGSLSTMPKRESFEVSLGILKCEIMKYSPSLPLGSVNAFSAAFINC